MLNLGVKLLYEVWTSKVFVLLGPLFIKAHDVIDYFKGWANLEWLFEKVWAHIRPSKFWTFFQYEFDILLKTFFVNVTHENKILVLSRTVLLV